MKPAADQTNAGIAAAIAEVADAAKKLLAGPLGRRAILVLIHDTTGPGITKKQINEVLEAAAGLRDYLKGA